MAIIKTTPIAISANSLTRFLGSCFVEIWNNRVNPIETQIPIVVCFVRNAIPPSKPIIKKVQGFPCPCFKL